MKVQISYYEQSFDSGKDYAFQEILTVDNIEQAKIAAIYDCQDQDFNHYEIVVIEK